MPLPRFHLRTLMIAVAFVAVDLGLLRACLVSHSERCMISLAVSLTVTSGWVAMRCPWRMLAVILLLWTFLPITINGAPIFYYAAMLGWVVGSLVGLIPRYFHTKDQDRKAAAPESE